jgi:ribosomal protein S18 acetylase RimI-like enzyme
VNAAPQIGRVSGAAAREEFEALARIHTEAIRDGFLSTLGEDFLVLLYRSLATAPEAMLFDARLEGQPAGLICGSVNTAGVYRHFLWNAGLRALPRLLPRLVSLSVVVRALETLVYPARNRSVDLPAAEILNFCVARDARGRGVGALLFQALMEEFRRRKVPRIRIVTGEEQLEAQAFYERVGAKRVGTICVHGGVPSIVYTYDIASGDHAAR